MRWSPITRLEKVRLACGRRAPPRIWTLVRRVRALCHRLAEEGAGDDHAVHLGRAFPDPPHARLAVPAFQRELLGYAVAAVDLDGGVDHAPEHLARVQLGDGGLHARVLAAIRLPGALPD